MNKLEKQKIEEVEKELYNLNLYLGVNYIDLEQTPSKSEMLRISDSLARCIRILRNLR